jgi:DNA-binding response OmpR family regulator
MKPAGSKQAIRIAVKPVAIGKNNGAPGGVKALKILVVEDHADMRTGLAVFFKLCGCQARLVPDVAAARSAIRAELFDVLLSDIHLPDGNGWALLRELQELGRRPAMAIAMSGFGSAKDLSASREAGFDLHLIKPFAPEELASALERAAEARPEKSAGSATPRKRKLTHLRSDGGPAPYVYPLI